MPQIPVRGDTKTSQERSLQPEHAAPAPPIPTPRRIVARLAWAPAVRRLAAGAALCAALLAAGPSARAAPRSGEIPPPSPAAVAVARNKCTSCHALPAPGCRRDGWGQASMNMHVRRVALPPSEWALVREYLGVPREIR